MTQPTPYALSYSFTDFSARTPTAQTPGIKLDAEFTHVQSTLTGVLTNLALIQRDDGRLANASVGADQIDPTFFTYVLDQVYALAVSGTMVALAARPTYAALAATGGAALIGTVTGNVQSDLSARPTSVTLAANGGAALLGTSTGVTVETRIANEEAARSAGDTARPTSATLAAVGGAALIGSTGGITAQAALDLKAPLASPALTGVPTAPTATGGTSTTQLATTAFATTADALRPTSATLAASGGAALIGTTAGTVQSDLNLKAPLASPALTGTPTVPTAAALTNTAQAASTAYADAATLVEKTRALAAEALLAPLASPTLTGVPVAPTAAANTNTTQIATTAFATTADALRPTSTTLAANGGAALIGSSTGVTVEARIAAEETARASGDTARPTSATLAASGGAALIGTTAGTVQSDLNLKAPLASPALTGTPTVPTAAASTNTTQAASTAYADAATLVEKTRALAAEALLAPLASPTLTGVPVAPTAAANTNTTQIATTAFATTADALRPTSTTLAASGGAALIGTTAGTVQSDLNLKAPLASPALTGVPTAPTASGGTSTTQVATTAFATTADALRPTSTTLAATGGAALIGATDPSGGSLWTTIQGFIDTLGGWKTGYYTAGARTMRYWRQIIATINDPTIPEVGDYIELNQTVAPTGATGTYYKIGRASLVQSTVTVPELYGDNTVVVGKGGPGFGFLYGHEVDINNNGAHADEVNTGVQTAYGYVAASGGTARGTAGFYAAGYFDTPKWAKGFCTSGYIKDADFYTSSNAQIGVDLRGSHQVGIDTQSCTSMNYAMVLKNNLPIAGLTTTPVAVNLVMVNPSNLMELGDAALGYIQTNQSILPRVDNTYLLGNGALRFNTIYSASGVVTTSDPSTKTDIEPITADFAWSILDGVSLISYRNINGGNEVSIVEEDGEVEETVMVDDGFEVIEPPKGAWWKKKKPRLIPKQKFEKRMVPGKVRREIVTPRPGKRRHFSIDATGFSEHLELLGLDAGIYVRDGGLDMVRMEQFIPLALACIYELRERIVVLEAK